MAKREKKRKGRARGNGSGSVFKRTPGGPWYMSWYDHKGERQTRSSGTTDKRAAERILARNVADVRLRVEGVIDPAIDAIAAESRKSFDAHLEDFRAKMRAAGRSGEHVRRTSGFIQAMAESQSWGSISDITADDVNHYAAEMKRAGRSNRTQQAHIRAIKSFTRWLATHRKLQFDPLLSVTPPSPKTDRRLERRMLLPGEWPWVESATREGPLRFGMPGAERSLLYCTAIQTGLRSSELRSLTRGRLFLESRTPHVTCPASITKNAKEARQYIQPDLAEALAEHVARKAPGAPVFAMPVEWEVAKMLRADLAVARSDWLDEVKDDAKALERRMESDFLADTNHEGKRLDFHSLRHTCGAWLALAGEHPKVIQSIMRHSTITLTLDTYGHLMPDQESEAVAKFPATMSGRALKLLPTGTET